MLRYYSRAKSLSWAEYTSQASFGKAAERRNCARGRTSVRASALIFRADLGLRLSLIQIHFACEIGTPAGALPLSFSAAFSALRAPTIILMASLLLSLHAYSHSGPATELSGTTADHGFVQVFGSSTVTSYSMVSASTRLKYSVIFNVLASAFR